MKLGIIFAIICSLLPVLEAPIHAATMVERNRSKSDLMNAASIIVNILEESDKRADVNRITPILSQDKDAYKVYKEELTTARSIIAQPLQGDQGVEIFTEGRINPTLNNNKYAEILRLATISESAKESLQYYITYLDSETERQLLLQNPEFKTYEITGNDKKTYLMQPLAAWLLEYISTIQEARAVYKSSMRFFKGQTFEDSRTDRKIDQLFPDTNSLIQLVDSLGTTPSVIANIGDVFRRAGKKLSILVSEKDPIAPYSTFFTVVGRYSEAAITRNKMHLESEENIISLQVLRHQLTFAEIVSVTKESISQQNSTTGNAIWENITQLITLYTDSKTSSKARPTMPPQMGPSASGSQPTTAPQLAQKVKLETEVQSRKEKNRLDFEQLRALVKNAAALEEFPKELQPFVKPLRDIQTIIVSSDNKQTKLILQKSAASYANYMWQYYQQLPN